MSRNQIQQPLWRGPTPSCVELFYPKHLNGLSHISPMQPRQAGASTRTLGAAQSAQTAARSAMKSRSHPHTDPRPIRYDIFLSNERRASLLNDIRKLQRPHLGALFPPYLYSTRPRDRFRRPLHGT